jgi:RES domain
MTVLYPRERVREVLRPLSLATAHRIVLKPYLSDPLTVRSSKSRFCDGRTYAVLYAAGDFATAFAEVVVRDRLVQRDRRLVPFGDIAARGWVEFASNQVPLQMVDLRESGCLILGAPTDTAHARNQAAVAAPPPAPASSKPLPNRVFSVVLKADEDVEWAWTSSPDGVSYVTGYTIVRPR